MLHAEAIDAKLFRNKSRDQRNSLNPRFLESMRFEGRGVTAKGHALSTKGLLLRAGHGLFYSRTPSTKALSLREREG